MQYFEPGLRYRSIVGIIDERVVLLVRMFILWVMRGMTDLYKCMIINIYSIAYLLSNFLLHHIFELPAVRSLI
jgi:hypothetical protein